VSSGMLRTDNGLELGKASSFSSSSKFEGESGHFLFTMLELGIYIGVGASRHEMTGN
jgi:hypothetical protein